MLVYPKFTNGLLNTEIEGNPSADVWFYVEINTRIYVVRPFYLNGVNSTNVLNENLLF